MSKEMKKMNQEVMTEAVEPCPFCEAENVYPNWDTTKQGFKAVCRECGEEIMLCDECLHADDNPSGHCDWHEELEKGFSIGKCFRGTTKHKI